MLLSSLPCPALPSLPALQRDWPASGDRFPAQYDSGGECGVPYYRRTRMPTPAQDQPWYSFDFGPIHFLQYSTGRWMGGLGKEDGSVVVAGRGVAGRGVAGVEVRGRRTNPTAPACAAAVARVPIHLLFLLSATPPAPAEHLFEPGSPQHDFIRADLAALNRTRTPWLVVGGHRPPYIDSTFYGLVPDGDQVVARQLRGALEDLFYSYQVQ